MALQSANIHNFFAPFLSRFFAYPSVANEARSSDAELTEIAENFRTAEGGQVIFSYLDVTFCLGLGSLARLRANMQKLVNIRACDQRRVTKVSLKL